MVYCHIVILNWLRVPGHFHPFRAFRQQGISRRQRQRPGLAQLTGGNGDEAGLIARRYG